MLAIGDVEIYPEVRFDVDLADKAKIRNFEVDEMRLEQAMLHAGMDAKRIGDTVINFTYMPDTKNKAVAVDKSRLDGGAYTSEVLRGQSIQPHHLETNKNYVAVVNLASFIDTQFDDKDRRMLHGIYKDHNIVDAYISADMNTRIATSLAHEVRHLTDTNISLRSKPLDSLQDKLRIVKTIAGISLIFSNADYESGIRVPYEDVVRLSVTGMSVATFLGACIYGKKLGKIYLAADRQTSSGVEKDSYQYASGVFCNENSPWKGVIKVS